nr:DUF645 family protein [Vibrio cholerae]
MLDVQHSKFGFTKGCIIAVFLLLCRGLLTVANLA